MASAYEQSFYRAYAFKKASGTATIGDDQEFYRLGRVLVRAVANGAPPPVVVPDAPARPEPAPRPVETSTEVKTAKPKGKKSPTEKE